MASDIKILWDDIYQEGDIKFQDEDLIREEGLSTAVLLSLFIDRRADSSDPLDDPNDLRGWWGDRLDADTNGDQIGSRLWLLDRSKTTQETINNCKIYAEEALQWMLDDGVCADINVTVERYGNAGNDRLALKVEILKKDGNTEVIKYNDVWDAQFA